MQKILIINSYYGFGSTGKIVECIDNYLENTELKAYCCYAWKVDKEKEKRAYCYGNVIDKYCSGLLTRITGNHYGYAWVSTTKLISFVKKIKPDIIHVHCINSYDVNLLRFFRFICSLSIPLVITEHAEFYHTGSCPYARECNQWIDGCISCSDKYYACKSKFIDAAAYNYRRMKKAFDGFKDIVFVSVSPWLLKRTKQSSITKRFASRCILNGIDTSVFKFYEKDEISGVVKKYFDMSYNVVHITSDFDSPLKGGNYIVDLAKENPNINFIIIGPGKLQVSLSNIKRISYISNMKLLAQFYSCSDLTIIASSRETFGMSVAESLCCGTPIIGFKAGGPESVTINAYSKFVDYGDLIQLNNALKIFLNKKIDKRNISLCAQEKYSAQAMAKQYYELYEELLHGEK